MKAETHVAIQGVCAWPNLQKLADGTLIASIFNQPCHGAWEGDLDCWASEDGGDTWSFRGRPAQHEPGTNRMNCAAGIANNGDMIVLCSGWNKRPPVGQPAPLSNGAVPLGPWVCRSSDGARTWEVTDDFPAQSNENAHIPFGDIVAGADGNLRALTYGRTSGDPAGTASLNTVILSSPDDGRTWADPVVVNDKGNETQAIHLGGGIWLAASREEAAGDVHLIRSDDDGKSWQRKMPLTLPRQHNGHLLRLKDGRIVLTFGNRCWNNYGVDIRVSEDSGETWGPPMRIADTDMGDCGYPSSIQRDDGKCVTAWYAHVSGEYHYEMRVTIWDLEEE